jgi:hypothetical protein
MVDTYVKFILTVIAVALVALVVQQAAPRATAAFDSCGGNSHDPCYMRMVN